MAGWLSLEQAPLGWRLAVLVAAPLLVITVVAGVRLFAVWETREQDTSVADRMERAALIDDAIGRVQDEREHSARFLAGPDGQQASPQLRADLLSARAAADAAIARAGLSATVPPFDVAAVLPPQHRATTPSLSVDDLDDLRSLVDRRVTPPADAILIYSTVVYSYLDAVSVTIGSDYSSPSEDSLMYAVALASAEAFIQARAWGGVLIASPSSDPREWLLLASLAQTEDFFISQARRGGTSRLPELDRLLDTPSSRGLDQLRWDLISGSGVGGAVTTGRWQQETQPRVDALNAASDLMLIDLIDDSYASVARAERELMLVAVLAIGLVGLVAVGAWGVTRSISRPLERLAVGARAASVGDLPDVDLPNSNDAIGEIGRAYGQLDRYLRRVADAAEEIAAGDLTREIRPRSSRDRLGTALQSMTQQLSSMVVRSRRRSAALEETVGQLEETAARDPLTGLLNRGRFVELVDEAIAAAERTNSRFGVLFMDLDGFKLVNDQFGHAAGDELLRQVASRLLSVLRVDDAVARLGGDEFTILVTSGFDTVAIEATARQVVEIVAAPYFVHGETIEIRASVGLATYPDHGATRRELIGASDRAMYAAKNEGGNVSRVAAAPLAA